MNTMVKEIVFVADKIFHEKLTSRFPDHVSLKEVCLKPAKSPIYHFLKFYQQLIGYQIDLNDKNSVTKSFSITETSLVFNSIEKSVGKSLSSSCKTK